jgi:hypothetical protein
VPSRPESPYDPGPTTSKPLVACRSPAVVLPWSRSVLRRQGPRPPARPDTLKRTDDVITRDEVVPLLLAASPSFQEIWPDMEAANYDDEEGRRLHYSDASAFASHLIRLQRKGATAEIAAAMQVIERLNVEGDDYVRELATVGYLEDIQNAALRNDVDLAEFVPYLGPESRSLWDDLMVFWHGNARRPIRPGDKP